MNYADEQKSPDLALIPLRWIQEKRRHTGSRIGIFTKRKKFAHYRVKQVTDLMKVFYIQIYSSYFGD